MDVDEIRTYAADRRRYSNGQVANAADAVADLREAYNLIANAWSSLSQTPSDDYRAVKRAIEYHMALVIGDIRAIVIIAELPEEMRL
jgi:hypothetical protein